MGVFLLSLLSGYVRMFLGVKTLKFNFFFNQLSTKNLNCFQLQKTKLRTEPRQEESPTADYNNGNHFAFL